MSDHDAETEALRLALASPPGLSDDYAAAAVAAAEAIAADAAAAVTAEAAMTAAAAVATALTAAIKASATAEIVASNAADAAAVAALLMPTGLTAGLQPGATERQLAAAARSRAGTVEVAAALAVATVAAEVAQAAAAAASAAAEVVRLVEARLVAETAASSAVDPAGAQLNDVSAPEIDVRTTPIPVAPTAFPDGSAGPWFAIPILGDLGLSVGGELDLFSAGALAAAFADRASDYSLSATYSLDLSAVTFIDLRGLRAVSDLHAAVVGAGQKLLVTPSLSPSVARTVTLAARNGWWEPTVRALTAGLPATVPLSRTAERRRPSRSAAVDRAAAAADRSAAALERDAAERLGRAAAAAIRSAERDSLTGALLRAPGLRLLEQMVQRARLGGVLTIAFIDVDNLKAHNDSRGHAAGDELLRAAASALRQGLRESDLVVRFGGDEFVCALPETALAEAQEEFRHIRTTLAANSTGATISVGCAAFEVGDDLDGLLRRADGAMYEERRRARD